MKLLIFEVFDFELFIMLYGCGVEKGYEIDGFILDFFRFCNIYREIRFFIIYVCDLLLMVKVIVFLVF